MRIYHTLGGQYLIHDREFSIGTVVLHLDNGIEIFVTNPTSIQRNITYMFYYISPIKKHGFRVK